MIPHFHAFTSHVIDRNGLTRNEGRIIVGKVYGEPTMTKWNDRYKRVIHEKEPENMITIDLETREVTGADDAKAAQTALEILKNKLEEDLRESMRRLEEQARQLGVDLTTYISGGQGRRKHQETSQRRPPSPPRYRHPKNPMLTWSGMGRQPAWFIAARNEGYTEEDLLIKIKTEQPTDTAVETVKAVNGETAGETEPASVKPKLRKAADNAAAV